MYIYVYLYICIYREREKEKEREREREKERERERADCSTSSNFSKVSPLLNLLCTIPIVLTFEKSLCRSQAALFGKQENLVGESSICSG